MISNILVEGKAGQGSNAVSKAIGKILVKKGYFVFIQDIMVLLFAAVIIVMLLLSLIVLLLAMKVKLIFLSHLMKILIELMILS